MSLGFAVTSGLALFLSLGIDSANTFFSGRYRGNLRGLLVNSLLVSLCSAVLAFPLVALGFRAFGGTVFRDYPAEGQTVLTILVPLQVLQLLLQGILVGLGLFRTLVAGAVLHYAVVLSALSVTAGLRWSFLSVLLFWGGGLALSNLIFLGALRPFVKAEMGSLRALLRNQLRYGLRIMLGNIATLLNFRTDVYLIAYFLTPMHLGWYTLASAIAEGLLYLPRAIAQVIFFAAANNARRIEVARIFRMGVVSTTGVLLLSVPLVHYLVPALLREAFQPAVLPAQILMFATFTYGLGLMATHYLYGKNEVLFPSKVALASAALVVTLDFVFVPTYGIVGAALCSLLAYALYGLLNLRRFLIAFGKSELMPGSRLSSDSVGSRVGV